MAWVIVLLVVVVALGRGGYDPWAMLVLELGAAGIVLWLMVEVLWGTRSEERALYLEQKRAWKRLPFFARHPDLASVFRLLTVGGFPKRYGTPDVEILPPGVPVRQIESDRAKTHLILLGFPFKRTGIGLPVLLLTLWMVASIVPLRRGLLEFVSPQAHSLRLEAESLMEPPPGSPEPAPWSLAPFLTLRSLWLWFAYLGLFYAAVHLAQDVRRVEKLTGLLLLVGIGFGIFGIGQWLFGLRDLFGTDPSAAGLRATGTFGNRNHYAAFMEMLLLCGVGWLGARWVALMPGRRSSGRLTVMNQEAKARLSIAALGIVTASLGLIFSLSRSGISFALAGCAAFALMIPAAYEPTATETIEIERSRSGRSHSRRSRRGKRRRYGRVYWALALAVLAVAFWIGIDPVVTRFELIPEQWEAEKGRYQVWLDSLGAVEDYWLTGSGLSSFRYVFPIYRSFGGRVFYSWAHNDYLQALIELGVPGFLLIVWILVGVVLGALRVRRELEGNLPLILLHTGFCAAALAIAFHSFTDFSLHLAADAALLVVVLGVVVGFGKPRAPARKGAGPAAHGAQ